MISKWLTMRRIKKCGDASAWSLEMLIKILIHHVTTCPLFILLKIIIIKPSLCIASISEVPLKQSHSRHPFSHRFSVLNVLHHKKCVYQRDHKYIKCIKILVGENYHSSEGEWQYGWIQWFIQTGGQAGTGRHQADVCRLRFRFGVR